MKAIHIACGAGGITLGFEMAGIVTAYAFDVAPVAVETHLANFPLALCEVCDIREVHAAALPRADVWTCGIPCEPYSVAGRKLADSDPRDIAFEVARLIRESRAAGNAPRYVFLENVPPFQESKGAQAIREALNGYALFEAVLCHADFGVPQKRRRWHLIASATPPVPEPEPTHNEAGSDLFGRRPWVRFGAIRDSSGASPLTANELRYVLRHIARQASKYGQAYIPAIVTDDDVLPTIVSSFHKGGWRGNCLMVYEDGRLRALSFLEAKRAQGFPDDFVFCGSRVEQWEQVGRAVPPPFAYAVAQAILGTVTK